MKDLKLYNKFEHWAKGGVIWLYSDTHFEDSDCKLMDKNWVTPEEQVKLINSKVGKCDTLIILGDIGDIDYIKQLKGYKVLIAGNHDAGASSYKRKIDKEFIKVSNEVMNDQNFDECRLTGNFEVINKKIVRKYLEEYKAKEDFAGISGVETDMRRGDYLTITYDNKLFDEVYTGPLFINNKILLSHEPINLNFGINIHGHVHDAKNSITYDGNSLDINVCSNIIGYTPVRLDEIIKGYKVENIHRIAIDKATLKKKRK